MELNQINERNQFKSATWIATDAGLAFLNTGGEAE
jgi:hypothetical protein